MKDSTVVARKILGKTEVSKETFDEAYNEALSRFMQMRFQNEISESVDFVAFWHLEEAAKIMEFLKENLEKENAEEYVRDITKCEIITESLRNLALKL